MQRWLDFKFSSSPKDPKRAPTGLGNSTDCGVRGSKRKVKHQNTKKSNTPRLKHKNTINVKHTSTVIDPMIALWWPSNVSRATYDNLHQLTIAKMIIKSPLLIITSNIIVKVFHLLNLIVTLAKELFTSSE